VIAQGPAAEQRAQNRGTSSGILAVSALSLLWVAGWEILAGGIPTPAVVWWLAGWGLLGLLGRPR